MSWGGGMGPLSPLAEIHPLDLVPGEAALGWGWGGGMSVFCCCSRAGAGAWGVARQGLEDTSFLGVCTAAGDSGGGERHDPCPKPCCLPVDSHKRQLGYTARSCLGSGQVAYPGDWG